MGVIFAPLLPLNMIAMGEQNLMKLFWRKYLLLFLSILAFGFVKAENTQTPYEIVPLNDSQYSSDQYHVVSFDMKEKHLFLDQYELFLVDFRQTDIPVSTYDSVAVNINGFGYAMKDLEPFIVKGVTKGSVKIKVAPFKAVEGKRDFVPYRSGVSGKVGFHAIEKTPLFKNDAIVLGLLVLVLAFVFYTGGSPKWANFYKYVPGLLLCYFIPSLLNSFGVISGEYSNLYYISSRYLLPASLILLCLSIDLKGIASLGTKAIVMFLAGTLGIIIGGPVAIMVISMIDPDIVGGTGADAVWKGMTTVAGSWIGGGANQTAMKEIYEPSARLFSAMVVVDIIVANIWMGILLYGTGISNKLDSWFKGDNSAIENLKLKLEKRSAEIAKMQSLKDLFIILAIGLGGTALAHWGTSLIKPMMNPELLKQLNLTALTKDFFWLIVIATTVGVGLSFTKLRDYEGAGASRVGSAFLYVLVASIGMHMDILEIFKNPGLFGLGIIWMIIHVVILILVAKLIKAPFFFVAVGSQANVGGAASAPVVASAFSPVLAPVGVLLAVLGYALGTYGAILCAEMMRVVSP